ncbi:hypothetical protein APHAL10511_005528 [Amanita phalloides]|nr:hypothetical protein APHAL10511_005528 [Amanita phalloides]
MLGPEVGWMPLGFGIVEWRFDQDTLREITAVLCFGRKQTRASALTLLPAPIAPGKVGERREKGVSFLLEEFEEAYGEESGDEYAAEIAAYVMEVEAKLLPRKDISTLDHCFIDRRAYAINELGRAWSSFKTWLDYSEETLWIAVNIFDRYFAVAKDSMTWNGCCLLTLVALFMASKYWEVSLPCLDDFARVVGLDSSKTGFRRGEKLVLKSLDYVICGGCSPWFWLNRRDRRQQQGGGLTEAVEDFLVQLAMRDPRFSAVLPSMVAATVAYTVNRMELTESMVEKGWAEDLWRVYDDVEIERGSKLLVEGLLSKELKASWVYRWYKREERHGASEFAVRWAKVYGDGC